MTRNAFAGLTAALLALACGGASDGNPGVTTPPNTSAIVASVTIAGTASAEVGKSSQLSAQALNAAGGAVAGKSFAWSSGSEAVATVTSDGVVTGRSAGATTITATVDGKSGSVAFTVTAPVPVAASVVVSGSQTLEAGTTTKLTATVKDAAGATMTGVPVTWISSDPTIMSVSSDGTVSALRLATVTITATAGGKSGTLDVTSTLAPYTFNFPAGTSATDAQAIRDAVQFGHSFFRTALGRTISKPTTVTSATSATGCDSRSGNAAFTGSGAVTFCVANQGWIANGPVSRQKIAIHELFHVWQFEARWLGTSTPAGAAWIIEGSAELVGYLAIDAKGLLPMSTARGCVVKEVTDFAKQQPPGLPPLSSVEPLPVFQTTVGPLYAYSLTAMDKLTTAGGIRSLQVYADAIGSGGQWQTSFQTAFGQTPATFYAQYPAYYATLPVPATYLCRV